MELLIPGLILVALMAWVSTKIKKRAAEAFEAETIETDHFSLHKPDGFLRVLESPDHAFEAYSKEFDEGDFRVRRAKIEIDLVPDVVLAAVAREIAEQADASTITDEDGDTIELEADETVNEKPFKAVYKLVSSPHGIYRLRFAVFSRHAEEYEGKVEEAFDSFRVKTS